MADFEYIRGRIYYGYGKASEKLGVEHTIYRSTDGINPIVAENIIGTQLISIDKDLKYNKINLPDKPIWQMLPEDGDLLEPYDFLVEDGNTYFIKDIFPSNRLSPPFCIECNVTVTIEAVKDTLAPGKNTYQGFDAQTGTNEQKIVNCPGFLHTKGRSKEDGLKLPTSVGNGKHELYIPYFPAANLISGDEVIDNYGRRYKLVNVFLTQEDNGYYLEIEQIGV